MRTNILTAAAVSFLTMTAVAQKDQVKNAEDALEDGNYAEAKAQLQVAEANLSELNDRWQENFYLYKGRAYMGNCVCCLILSLFKRVYGEPEKENTSMGKI